MKKLFQKINNEGMSAEEKSAMFTNLRKFVDQNPARIESPFYIPWFTMRQRSVIGLTVFAALFILTGGALFAARSAVPGDTLYPVKILNENIESGIALGHRVNAKVYTSHAVSRLEEVEQIVSSYGKLNRELREQIEGNFERQAEQAITNIAKLKGSGNISEASEMQSAFRSSLAEKERAMVRLLNDTNTETQTKEELSNVISNIQLQLEKAEVELSDKPEPEVKGDDTATSTPSAGEEEEPSDDNATSTPESATSTPSASSGQAPSAGSGQATSTAPTSATSPE